LENTSASQFKSYLESSGIITEVGAIQGATYFAVSVPFIDKSMRIIAYFSADEAAVTIFSVNYFVLDDLLRVDVLELINVLNEKYTKLKFVLSEGNSVKGIIFMDISDSFHANDVYEMMMFLGNALSEEFGEFNRLLDQKPFEGLRLL